MWWGTTTWTGEVLTLEHFLAEGTRPAGRPQRFARPPATPPVKATTAAAPASATQRVPVALAMVLVAEFFNTSRTALRVLFLPETMFANSGTKKRPGFCQTLWPQAEHISSSKASPLGPFAWQTHPFHQSRTVALVRGGMLMADVAVEFENHNEQPFEN